MTVNSTKAAIVEKLQELPEKELLQVLDFIHNLVQQQTLEEDPLSSVIGILSGEFLSSEEIDRELYGKE